MNSNKIDNNKKESEQLAITCLKSELSVKPSWLSLYQSLLYLLRNFYRQCQKQLFKIISTLSSALQYQKNRQSTMHTSEKNLRSNSPIHLRLHSENSQMNQNKSIASLFTLFSSSSSSSSSSYYYYQRYLLVPIQPFMNQLQDLWHKLHLPMPENSKSWQYFTTIILPTLIILLYSFHKIRIYQRSLNNKSSSITSSTPPSRPSSLSSSSSPSSLSSLTTIPSLKINSFGTNISTSTTPIISTHYS
ncbi:hypothetical protein H8356DRAFT_1639737 [Neocallimastix lanati (nom. inval.)]|nr:hypothetical protein H8356DRAFT_1639737 [Neocallimastix sp. JGI-2020a]